MSRIINVIARCCLLIFIMLANVVMGETLEIYAQKCDAEMGGVTVTDFNCDSGAEVPMTNFNPATGSCDEPNRLNEVCDPGSRFQVLANTPNVHIVAHCRKKGLGAGRFGDIAVIQYNRTTGATCFYQALGDLPGEVKAPSKGIGAFWHTPEKTAAIQCVHCHDNGPIIRSPYLAQLKTGPNALPGATDTTFNSKNQPYRFVGEDFATWKVYRVEVDNNLCISCHRLGVSNLSSGVRGTAIDFAVRATGPAGTEPHKNPLSASSPIWMPPSHVFFDQNNANAAKQIHDCAVRISEIPLPNLENCRITEYTGQNVPKAKIGAIWEFTGTPCSGESCPSWRKLDNNNKTISIVSNGNELYQLHNDGWIWRYTGTPCNGDNCSGWQRLDNNSKTAAITSSGNELYQLHNDGWIWRYTGTPCNGDNCSGWQRLDNNPYTAIISAAGTRLFQLHTDSVYQLHNDGWAWRYIGPSCSGDSCPGWQRLDNNKKTVAIAAAGKDLYQLHNDGWIWRYTGKPCIGDSCPSWQRLDNNLKTKKITTGGLR